MRLQAPPPSHTLAGPMPSPTMFEFFYDLASPYSYLASTQIAGIEGRTGARARLIAITLGGLRKSTGHQIPPPQQLKYMAEDTARWAQKYSVPMQIPKAFPVSTINALRACIAAARDGVGDAATRALFHAYWVEGEDISDAKAIEAALTKAGLDGKRLVARAQDQEIKDELRRNTDLALARGVFGVPMIFVGERSFWGNDRLEFVESALRHARLSS
jgi:2-hydroxychromene-2-carboxylate isomerase